MAKMRKRPLCFFLQENERRRVPDYIPEGCETHMKTICADRRTWRPKAFKQIILDDVLLETGDAATGREEVESGLRYVPNDEEERREYFMAHSQEIHKTHTKHSVDSEIFWAASTGCVLSLWQGRV